jgi:hypothetical protein
MTASGTVPPPDRDSLEVVTAGEIVPLRLACKPASRLFQAPLRHARTGLADSVTVKLPSGFAVVADTAVVSAGTGTGWLVAFAWAWA